MTSAHGLSAFVPNGDSRKDTATLLIGAALDAGLDDSREVVAASGGFYISDALADFLGSEEYEASTPTVSGNPEIDKAEAQLEAQRPPIEDAEAVVDNAVDVYDADDFHEASQPDPEPEPEPKAKATKKTSSGNRAEKQDSKEE